MRELRYHEKKLLKKVDFLEWRQERNVREIQILRRYLIQNRDDYHKYVYFPLFRFFISVRHDGMRSTSGEGVRVTSTLMRQLFRFFRDSFLMFYML